MALPLEQVGRVVADVAALDVFNVDTLVHVVDEVLKSLNKQVAGGLVSEGAKPGQSGADDGNGAAQLPPLGG